MVAQLNADYIRTRPLKIFPRLISYLLFEGRPLTTRGQWMNPLIFAHFSIVKKIPQFKKIKQPVYILGTGRSGTTILGIVLSMHRDVGFLNEPKAIWHSVYPSEDLIGSYSRGKAAYRLDASNASSQEKKSLRRLLGAYLTISFSKRVVDKYPELIFRVPYVKALCHDAKFLFLVRNGWDTCHSIEAWAGQLGKQKNGEIHDWWGANRRKWILLVEQIIPEHQDLAPFSSQMLNWTNHVDMAAVEWIVSMREGMKLVKKHPNEVLRVNYEELCISPKTTMQSIMKFCEFSTDDVFLDYTESALHTVEKREPFTLAKELEKPFSETMKQLGY